MPQTVPGDTVRLLVLKTKTSYGYAKAIEIITPSKNRVAPPCEHFSKCGGCQLMSLDYSEQLAFKRQTVADALGRIGGFDAEPEIIGMTPPERYRNKMVFPFAPGGRWGFYRQHSHDVVILKDCLLGDKLNAEIMNTVSDYIKRFNIPVYDEKSHTGIMRRAFIRTGGGDIMVVISANADSLPHSDELVAMLRSISGSIAGIILNVNKKRTNLVLGDKNITLWGKEKLSAELCGLTYEVSPHSFFQVNPVQTEKLYNKAIEYADISPEDIVMDIYCGIGTISLTAAKYAKRVVGVEIVPQAIEDAKKNAVRNGIGNAEFICSAAEDIVPQLIKTGRAPDVVILDPPRKGSDEKTLAAILAAMPKRIVYVSCNPATLARDARILADGGYELRNVTAVDMFPFTTHVETVCLMSRICSGK